MGPGRGRGGGGGGEVGMGGGGLLVLLLYHTPLHRRPGDSSVREEEKRADEDGLSEDEVAAPTGTISQSRQLI